jgi:hypothetical protein
MPADLPATGLPVLDLALGALATAIVTIAFVAALLRPERF